MRRWTLAALGVAAFATTLVADATAQLKLPRPSPAASVTQTIGLTEVTVTYSRPGVKGRTIWGDLVPYDKVWRTGANEATTLAVSDEVEFGGKKLAAGTYAVATIPGRDEWTVILNRDHDMWGTQYDESKDVLRITAKPMTGGEKQEWLGFSFENLAHGSADLVLAWDRLRLAVPIRVDVNARAMANARAAVAAAKPDDWRTPYQAASFTLNSDHGMDEGRTWLEQSLKAQENYFNLNLLARWQAKTGRRTEAVATAKKAIEAAKKSPDRIDTAPTEKLIAEWSGKS